MIARLTKNEFIDKSNAIHNFIYDYSLVVYKASQLKVKIICPTHGVFEKAPNKHISSKQGCPKCSKEFSLQKFIKKAIVIHGNKYDYTNSVYNKDNKKINILCLAHDKEFILDANGHLRGQDCQMCGQEKRIKNRTFSQEEFIKKANLVHNNKYIYTLTSYKHNKEKIAIICPIHGKFMQRASNHIQGKGCTHCNHKPTYSRAEWIAMCNSKESSPIVYIIRCFNLNEEFVKIGITSRSIYSRFMGNSKMPYSYEVIKEIKGSPDFVWDKEKELHSQFKQYKHNPLIYFAGETECFNNSILKNFS